MSRRSWWLLLAAVVCMVASFHSVRAADEVRSGTKFNPAASPIRKFVRRSVDSTGTVAGALDSAVLIQPTQRMPVPVTMGGVYLSDTSSRVFATDNSGNAKVVDASRDRDLDYYATVINSTTADTGAVYYSGIVDLRKYATANIIIHLVPAAADTTTQTWDFGVTVYPLPTQSYDWTGYGVPVPAVTQSLTSSLTTSDSLGFWTATAVPTQRLAGERIYRFRARQFSPRYTNISGATTLSIPLSSLLAPGQRCRFFGVALRGVSRSGSAPLARLDVEALR